MRIAEIISQSRRDFYAIYECEACGFTKKDYGYNDANFHNNVIPNMACDKCDKKSLEVTSTASIPAHVVI